MALSKKIHLMPLQSAKLRRKPLKLWRKSSKIFTDSDVFPQGNWFYPSVHGGDQGGAKQIEYQPRKGLNYLKLNAVFNDLFALKT